MLFQKIINKFNKSEAVSDLIGLYLIQAVQVALPLLMVPYLARVIGPSEWGTIAYFQSFALYIALILEFGFGLSGTRSVARNRDSIEFRSKILSEVNAAKLLLAIATFVPLGAAFHFVRHLNDRPIHFFAAIIWGLSQGGNLVWYFQGLGRLRKLALFEVSSRICAAAAILAFVHSAQQGWLIILLNALGSCCATAGTLAVAYSSATFVKPTLRSAVSGIKSGFTMFLFRSAVSLYTLGNSFILGCFVPPIIVGYYSGAERISKGILSIVQPLNQTMYAHVNRSMGKGKPEAARIARQGIAGMTLLGLALSVFVFFTAPTLVNLMLGQKFGPSIPAVRILAALPLLICFATSLGSNWMLPLNLDKQFNWIILSVGVTNVAMAAYLAPKLQHIGMCIAVTTSEALVGSSFLVFLWWKKLDPFRHTVSREFESQWRTASQRNLVEMPE